MFCAAFFGATATAPTPDLYAQNPMYYSVEKHPPTDLCARTRLDTGGFKKQWLGRWKRPRPFSFMGHLRPALRAEVRVFDPRVRPLAPRKGQMCVGRMGPRASGLLARQAGKEAENGPEKTIHRMVFVKGISFQFIPNTRKMSSKLRSVWKIIGQGLFNSAWEHHFWK